MPRMVEVFSLLMAVMFPLRPLLRITRLQAWFLEQLTQLAEDGADPRYCAELEAALAFGKEGLNLLVGYRVQELLGQRFRGGHWRSPRFPTPRPYSEILARFARLLARLGHIQRLTRRRANQLRRQMAKNLVNIASSVPATTHASAHPLDVLPRQRRGRWIARHCTRDGGRCALSRGPPATSCSEISSTQL